MRRLIVMAMVVLMGGFVAAMAAEPAPAPSKDSGAATAATAATPPSAAPDKDKAKAEADPAALLAAEVKEHGVTAGKPVDAGFVFYDGRYIEAPYTVSRKGLGVYINDVLVNHLKVPEPLPAGDVDPKVPAEINKDTSFYDKVLRDYCRQKVAFLQKHVTPEEEAKIMEQAYRALPCIQEAHLDDKDPVVLHLTTFKGEEIPVSLRSGRRKGLDTKEAVLGELERIRTRFEEQLLKGCCYFLFSGGRMDVGGSAAAGILRKIVPILRSDNAVDVKREQIKKAGLTVPEGDPFTKLITDFKASKQLDERLSKPPAPSKEK
jgi:hypothetical protein